MSGGVVSDVQGRAARTGNEVLVIELCSAVGVRSGAVISLYSTAAVVFEASRAQRPMPRREGTMPEPTASPHRQHNSRYPIYPRDALTSKQSPLSHRTPALSHQEQLSPKLQLPASRILRIVRGRCALAKASIYTKQTPSAAAPAPWILRIGGSGLTAQLDALKPPHHSRVIPRNGDQEPAFRVHARLRRYAAHTEQHGDELGEGVALLGVVGRGVVQGPLAAECQNPLMCVCGGDVVVGEQEERRDVRFRGAQPCSPPPPTHGTASTYAPRS